MISDKESFTTKRKYFKTVLVKNIVSNLKIHQESSSNQWKKKGKTLERYLKQVIS